MENIYPDFYRNLSGEALTFKRFIDQSHKRNNCMRKILPNTPNNQASVSKFMVTDCRCNVHHLISV